jgi:hypothetical protein
MASGGVVTNKPAIDYFGLGSNRNSGANAGKAVFGSVPNIAGLTGLGGATLGRPRVI